MKVHYGPISGEVERPDQAHTNRNSKGIPSLFDKLCQVRIFIFDEHEMVRDGLRMILKSEPDFEVVGDTGDYREVLGLVLSEVPDVVVFDVSMLSWGDFLMAAQVLEPINARCPSVQTLVISSYRDEPRLRYSLAAGAKGLLLKDAFSTELFKALHTVARGETYLDPALSGQLVNSYLNAFHVRPALMACLPGKSTFLFRWRRALQIARLQKG